MKTYSLLLFLSFLGFISCKKEMDKEREFGKYHDIPSYISSPNAAHSSYFNAYDQVLEKWGVSFEELYIPTSHGFAHVIVSGPKNGVPVVLLHGMNASSTMWYPNVKAMTQEYRIFAIDLLNEPGKSYKTSDFNKIDEITTWYQEILWALKLDSFHLIGASRGGWFAVDLALKSKRDIRSMVLLSPAQTFTWIPPSSGLLKNIFSVFSSKEKKVENTLETMSSNVNNIDPTYKEQFYKSHQNDSLNKFMMQMTPFANSKLKNLKMPTLVLIGDDDIINSKKTIRLTERHLAKGKGEVIPNAGHFLSVDQAGVVNAKILHFLKEVDKTR